MKTRHAIKFVDTFSFATVTKSADLTPSEVEAIERQIKAGEIVHTHTVRGINYKWIPTKVYKVNSIEERAEKLLTAAKTGTFN